MASTPNTTSISLSDKTILEIRPDNYGSPYIAFGRKQTTSTRWVFLSTSAWQTLAKIIPEVSTILKQGLDKEMRLQLNGRLLLAVSKFWDKYYVDMHYVNQQGDRVKGRGLNLNIDEWKELVRNVGHINIIMNQMKSTETQPLSSASSSSQKRPNQSEEKPENQSQVKYRKADSEEMETAIQPKVKQYQWQNIMSSTNQVVEKDCIWTFSERSCKQRLEDHRKHHPHTSESSKDVLETREIPLPSDQDLINWIIQNLYRDAIGKMMRDRCIACELDLPGQMDHMDGGCLMEWEHAVDRYLSQAELVVSRLSVTETFRNVKSALEVNVPMTEADLPTLALMIACAEQTLESDLKRDKIDENFVALFNRVCLQSKYYYKQ